MPFPSCNPNSFSGNPLTLGSSFPGVPPCGGLWPFSDKLLHSLVIKESESAVV